MLLHGLLMFVGTLKATIRIREHFPFDLIDGHYVYPDGLAAVLLSKAFGKPVVLSARGSDINQFSEFRLIAPMIKYALRRANHIISVCDAIKEKMVAYGVPSHKVTIIPNGVDSSLFSPIDSKKARERLGLVNGSRIILSVGGLIPRKGFGLLLNAMKTLTEQYPDSHLYIIGEGPLRRPLEDDIKRLSLGPYVTLVGERPHQQLPLWYSSADVFCLASEREGWANVIMESLACGTPVVATNVWGAPEILTSRNVGILVKRDPGAIAGGLTEALNRSWNRKRIRRHVEERTWSIVAQEVRGVFEKFTYTV
jgi:glycosyltransferase involved in cell wall biosynthesis